MCIGWRSDTCSSHLYVQLHRWDLKARHQVYFLENHKLRDQFLGYFNLKLPADFLETHHMRMVVGIAFSAPKLCSSGGVWDQYSFKMGNYQTGCVKWSFWVSIYQAMLKLAPWKNLAFPSLICLLTYPTGDPCRIQTPFSSALTSVGSSSFSKSTTETLWHTWTGCLELTRESGTEKNISQRVMWVVLLRSVLPIHWEFVISIVEQLVPVVDNQIDHRHTHTHTQGGCIRRPPV